MKNVTTSAFRFVNFFIKESQIKREPGKKQGKFNLNIEPHGFINKEKKEFQLHLIVTVNDSEKSFEAKIHSVGIFKFRSDLTQQRENNYFYVNAPAVLFPHIRSYISSLTALSGLYPINLPLLNLTYLRDTLKQNTEIIKTD